MYNAGILLMLLMVDGRRPSFGQGIADALAVSIDPQTGWWSYEADADPNVGLAARITINLSTSQFAALGLWAATRLGLRLDPSVWSKHAEGLCRAQKRSGSWAYSPWLEAGTMGNTDGYPTGTFMGCANLALARRRGESRIDPKSPLGLRVDAAWESALGALNRDAKVFLSTTGKTPPEWQLARRDGFSYYTLYALEKACIFADLEKIGGVSWYRTGAETLLRFQSKDGSWSYEGGEDPIVSTAFALLFLLRSSQSYHPVTPRDVDANPAAPTTPREPAMSGDGPVPEGGDRPTPPK